MSHPQPALFSSVLSSAFGVSAIFLRIELSFLSRFVFFFVSVFGRVISAL